MTYDLLVYDLFSENLNKHINVKGSASLDPPARRVRCGNLQSAMSTVNSANSAHKQSSTLRKTSASESSYVIQFYVETTESIAGNIVHASYGSLSFVDAGAIQEQEGKNQPGVHSLKEASILHTYTSLERALKGRNMMNVSPSAVCNLISDCFGQRGINFVVLGVSALEKDFTSTKSTFEFGSRIH